MNTLITLFTGIAIYAVFRLVRVFLLNPGKIRGEKAGGVFTTLELIVWMLYFFWCVDRLFESKSYYDFLFVGLVFLFVALIAWFYVKDLVAGALFKIQYNPKSGKYLHAENAEGAIRKIGATHLTLESAGGEWVRIPFSRLQGSTITQGSRKDHTGDFRIRLRLARSIPKEEAAARIRTTVLQDPFCSYKRSAEIRQVEEDADGYIYEVSFTAIGAGFLSRIEKRLGEVVR